MSYLKQTLQAMNEDNLRLKWMSLIKDCRSSGLPVRQWCHREHIGVSTYYHWQRKIFDQTVASSSNTPEPYSPLPQFAEIVVPQTNADSSRLPSATARLTIGNATVEIFQPLTSSMLKVLLQVVTHA